MSHSNPSRTPYQLVIFDMDGTLTEELLDFAAIRRDIGLPATGGILEQLALMAAEEQSRAAAILHGHEMRAADSCLLHAGAAEVLAALGARGIRTALLTRNSAACAERILARHALPLDFVATREHLPHKPHPDSILNIARRFGVAPRQTLMVGDYLYDMQAASAAGTDCALLCTTGEWPAFASMATHRIRALPELLALMDGDSL